MSAHACDYKLKQIMRILDRCSQTIMLEEKKIQRMVVKYRGDRKGYTTYIDCKCLKRRIYFF